MIETSNKMLGKSNSKGNTCVRREAILGLEKDRYDHSLRLAHDTDRVLRTTLDALFIFEDAERNDNERKNGYNAARQEEVN